MTGGRFWAPYNLRQKELLPTPPKRIPETSSPVLIAAFSSTASLSISRTRNFASSLLRLGPAYVRVSGTWRNATYFQNNDDPPLKSPPEGFNGVLTRRGGRGKGDSSILAKAVNAEIVASVATSAGTRDADGVSDMLEQAKPWA